ncbi:O-methyltransferase [Apiospora arundinis]
MRGQGPLTSFGDGQHECTCKHDCAAENVQILGRAEDILEDVTTIAEYLQFDKLMILALSIKSATPPKTARHRQLNGSSLPSGSRLQFLHLGVANGEISCQDLASQAELDEDHTGHIIYILATLCFFAERNPFFFSFSFALLGDEVRSTVLPVLTVEKRVVVEMKDSFPWQTSGTVIDNRSGSGSGNVVVLSSSSLRLRIGFFPDLEVFFQQRRETAGLDAQKAKDATARDQTRTGGNFALHVPTFPQLSSPPQIRGRRHVEPWTEAAEGRRHVQPRQLLRDAFIDRPISCC